MNKTPSKKEQTRQRMLKTASQSFRSNGYYGIGVDGIAKAAGVTSGAFYAHFGSKDGAFSAALDHGLDEVIETLPKLQAEKGDKWIKAFVDYYLGKAHRENLSCGCAMATLTPEVVRASKEIHAAYETKMKIIANLIAKGLEGESLDDRIARAWAMIGILIGGLTMSRAVKTRKAAEEIAAAIKIAAIAVTANEKVN